MMSFEIPLGDEQLPSLDDVVDSLQERLGDVASIAGDAATATITVTWQRTALAQVYGATWQQTRSTSEQHLRQEVDTAQFALVFDTR